MEGSAPCNEAEEACEEARAPGRTDSAVTTDVTRMLGQVGHVGARGREGSCGQEMPTRMWMLMLFSIRIKKPVSFLAMLLSSLLVPVFLCPTKSKSVKAVEGAFRYA